MNYTSMKKRKSVSYSKDLEFPIDEVWSIISAPQNLENCHPFCKTNSTIEWHDQHHDVLQYLNGRKFYREFLIWKPMEGCLLYTSPSPRDQRGSRMPSSA